jgi:hypothetical protein
MVRFIDRMQHLQPLKKAADIAAIRPLGYVVRRLGFRPDVINRVRLMAAEDSAQYITEKMMPCAVFDDRYSVFDLAIRQMPKQGLVVEFGVFNGRSINYIAKRIGARQISGFDSFEGLAEDWEGTGASKGHFGRGGVMPKVVNNVTLVKGWFDKTLPGYLEKNPGPVHLRILMRTPMNRPSSFSINWRRDLRWGPCCSLMNISDTQVGVSVNSKRWQNCAPSEVLNTNI